MATQLPGLTQQQTALAQLGLSAAAGAAGGGPQNQKTLQTSTPNIPSNVQPLQTGILGQALQGLQAPDLRGYTSSGLENINQNTRNQSNILKNTLAARGLTYSSPLASAEESNIAQQGGGQQTAFLNSIPLLRQQLLQQNLSGAVNAFRSMPYGQQIAGTGSITQPGGILAGLLAGLAQGTNLYGANTGGGPSNLPLPGSTPPVVGGDGTSSPSLGGGDISVYPGSIGGYPTDPNTGIGGSIGIPPTDNPYGYPLPPSDPFNPGGIMGQWFNAS